MKKTFSDRIVAGRWKGRSLILPVDEGLRPTKNRVRQAIFNMLGSRLDWEGLRVVDLCCGSGALGLEAASRGASEVVLVDMKTGAAVNNMRSLGAGEPQVRTLTVDATIYHPKEPFDVVLMDPPYGNGIVQTLIARRALWGKAGSWWVMECGVGEELDMSGFEGVVTRVFGVGKVVLGRMI